ncbi:MAG: Xaa-Pro peptidase family protein [Proteobacteria bacterium]|nr:Xaa-Pro peptidase family protein [Pseudomonadota bacterium]MBU1582015.1 Xaa-Pro peptidase family protein [Pseudomonadota bacterium]MBU2456259.1 Xaa-Pro peptidase family protein [Pseudomonadota bacterium]MBU2630627.1 Xaa-Pro peptidase family protein [Pseudomonadota bacterium]
MAFQKTPEQEIKNRIHTLKQKMDTSGIEAIFLTHKPDIFYFSGTSQDCYLYIHVNQDPVLFVKRYFPRAKKESCIKDIFQISSITQIPIKIKALHSTLPKTCGLAFDVVPIRDYEFYQNLFHATTFKDGTPAIHACREIKSAYEIDQLKKAARLSEKTFSYIRKNIVPGISEIEFCGVYETFARKHGHAGKVLTRHYRAQGYPFHLLSGKNGGLAGAVDTPCSGMGTSIAHPFGAGAKLIQRNEPILIDFGTLLNGYHLDETRMFAIGAMPPKAMDVSKMSIDILHLLLSMMKPGVIMGDLFDASVQMAKQMGVEEQFLGLPGIKSIFIGHGIGLELVEPPMLSKGKKDILKPGMIFAVEPKFIFKNKFAAGIESVIQITETSACFLSTTPHDVVVLE